MRLFAFHHLALSISSIHKGEKMQYEFVISMNLLSIHKRENATIEVDGLIDLNRLIGTEIVKMGKGNDMF